MNKSMVRPYFYQAVQCTYFLNLNEQQNLTLSRSRVQGEWGQEEILQQDCSRFVAAPDGNDCLHIIAADSHNKLCHIIVTKGQVQTKPFIILENSGPFLLSFSVNGMGYFFCIEDSKSGKLKAAKYSPAFGWRDELSPEQSYSVPVSLAIDISGGIHLLLYDVTNDSLNYYYRNQGMNRWADLFCLESSLKLSVLPALWVTAGQNIHIAWFVPHKHTVCYRMKKAGGWPVGGWQHEQYLPLDTPPSLVSFHEESENVKVWCIGSESKPNVFCLKNGTWQQVSEETDDCLPVRHGTIGGESYNLADAFPPTSLFFTTILNQTTKEDALEPKNEQEQRLLDQIKQLTEEKRSLQALLQKKEESLAQYRLMLEHSHKKSSKQRSELAAKVDDTLGNLEKGQNENKSLVEQLKQVQKKLSAKEAALKDSRRETDTLRLDLTKSKQQKEDGLAMIRKMETEYGQYRNENKALIDQLEQVQKELSVKEEEYRKCRNDNKSLREQLKQVQKTLASKEAAIKHHQAETDTMRFELTKSKQQEVELMAAIGKMKTEMESKKGVLNKISSAFQKKE